MAAMTRRRPAAAGPIPGRSVPPGPAWDVLSAGHLPANRRPAVPTREHQSGGPPTHAAPACHADHRARPPPANRPSVDHHKHHRRGAHAGALTLTAVPTSERRSIVEVAAPLGGPLLSSLSGTARSLESPQAPRGIVVSRPRFSPCRARGSPLAVSVTLPYRSRRSRHLPGMLTLGRDQPGPLLGRRGSRACFSCAASSGEGHMSRRLARAMVGVDCPAAIWPPVAGHLPADGRLKRGTVARATRLVASL